MNIGSGLKLIMNRLEAANLLLEEVKEHRPNVKGLRVINITFPERLTAVLHLDNGETINTNGLYAVELKKLDMPS